MHYLEGRMILTATTGEEDLHLCIHQLLQSISWESIRGIKQLEKKINKKIMKIWKGYAREWRPSVVEKGFLEMIVGVRFESVVQESDVAAFLQWPNVLFECFPLVPSLSLRCQKLCLWVQILNLSVRHCCWSVKPSSSSPSVFVLEFYLRIRGRKKGKGKGISEEKEERPLLWFKFWKFIIWHGMVC